MRLFVAIDTPQHVKDSLTALHDPEIHGARWVKPHTMHLTLRFIGEVDADGLARYRQALARVQGTPFEMGVRGVGRFPPSAEKAPRVLWAGIDAPDALYTLQAAVSAALEGAGLGKEAHRDYHPHLTLARLKVRRPADKVEAFLQHHADFEIDPFPVTEFVLYESELTPQGAVYTHRARYPLRNPDKPVT